MTSVVDYINKNFSAPEQQAIASGISQRDAQLIADEHNGKISSQDFINNINPQLLHVLKDRQNEIDYSNSPEAQTLTQKLGQKIPIAGHALADLATGGTQFTNDLKGVVGASKDNTNYYDQYGVQPNGIDNIATQSIRQLPYVAMPEAALANAGKFANAAALPSAIARAGARGVVGVGSNEMQNSDTPQKNRILSDALSGVNYAGTGVAGDILPYKAASLANKMQEERLPDSAIAEGNRASDYPDVGNIVGNPAGANKFNNLSKTLLSPAKDVQESSLAQVPARKYSAIQDADEKSMNLFDSLRGDASPEKIPQSISNDIQNSYTANKQVGNAKYDAIAPHLDKIQVADAPTIKDAAQGILADSNSAATFGITDPDLKNDIITRATNAANFQQMPASQALRESRALSGMASDLKARGQNNAARYYDQLGQAYESDIGNSVKNSDPDTYSSLMDAKDYWKNNVIPFRASPTTNKIINNNFDESVAPLNLSNTLTNGTNNQLLSVLPSQTKNKIAADLLYKKAFNGIGDASHPSVSLTNTLANMPQARLAPLLESNPSLTGSLTDIAKNVNSNQDVIGDLSNPTKVVNSDELSPTISNHFGIWEHLKNAPGVLTSPYWTKFLTNAQNPHLLPSVLGDNQIGLNDVRSMVKNAKGETTPVRSTLSSALTMPNATRLPLASALASAQNNQTGDDQNAN